MSEVEIISINLIKRISNYMAQKMTVFMLFLKDLYGHNPCVHWSTPLDTSWRWTLTVQPREAVNLGSGFHLRFLPCLSEAFRYQQSPKTWARAGNTRKLIRYTHHDPCTWTGL